MKGFKLGMIILAGLIFALLAVTTVSAQSGLMVSPTQLTVTGTRDAVETRTLLLRATEPVTSVQIIPLDLTSADGQDVLPASAIRVTPPADQVAAGGLLTVPVTIDLRGAPSGEFKGELLVTYHGGSLTVPVTATIKDPWLPPLIVLVVGVALGVGVSAYRARGRPRDEVLVRVGQIRAQVRGDAELPQCFQSRIEAYVVDVGAALQAEKWQDAQAAVGQAEAVWIRWRKGHDDWLVQLDYHTKLTERLEELNADAPYVQAVNRGLEAAVRDAPDLERPDELRQRLDTLARQVNRYLQLQARLDELNALRNRLSADLVEAWRRKAWGFQRQLNDLQPDDETAYQALQGEIETAIEEVTALAPVALGPEIMVKGVRGLGETLIRRLAPAPSVRSLTAEDQLAGARVRLQLFTWFSYAVAIILLAGAGFAELYVARPTFGANAWSDYFALLAWGFGAEATRAAVTEVLRGWGLPALKL